MVQKMAVVSISVELGELVHRFQHFSHSAGERSLQLPTPQKLARTADIDLPPGFATALRHLSPNFGRLPTAVDSFLMEFDQEFGRVSAKDWLEMNTYWM